MDIEKLVRDIFERNIGLNQEMLYKAITHDNVKDCIRDALKLHLSDVSGRSEQLPNYAKRGDYCAVCGCNEFFNDEEE